MSDVQSGPPDGLRVGLLGGSFNPAHDGHLHISHLALEKLALDEVWWLVSPQNPLKPVDGMAPLNQRLSKARAAATDPRIRATAIEQDLGTRYTADTLAALRTRFPNVRFVWLIGADLLIQMPRWKKWRTVFRAVPIAVFPRPFYSFRALRGTVAKRFARARVNPRRATKLADMAPPAWTFLKTPLHSASATRLRAEALVQSTGKERP